MSNSAAYISPAATSCSRVRRRGVAVGVAAAMLVSPAALGLGSTTAHATALPQVLKVGPAAAQVGTGVTLAGDFLTGTTAVTFLGGAGEADDVDAPHFIVIDPKKVLVQVPAGAESGPVRATTLAGASTGTTAVVAILKKPEISALSVQQGKPGDDVVISGAHLLGVKAPKILFGNKAAKPLAAPAPSQDSVTVKVPAGLAGGPTVVSVLTSGGTATTNFRIAPIVTAAAPLTAPVSGGTVLSVLGAGFTGVDGFVDDAATGAVDERFDGVTVGGVRVTRLIAVSDKEVVVQVPPGTDPAAPVVVKTIHDRAVLTSGDNAKVGYRRLPVVTASSQNWNLVGTPAPVVYSVSNIDNSTVVTVGKTALVDPPAVIDVEAGTITITPPLGLKPAVSAVTFTNTVDGVAHTATVPFSYIVAPTVAKLVPASGPAATPVLVSGTGFVSGTTVRFGGATASCYVSSAVLARCVVPAGLTGTPNVEVTTPAGTSAATPASTFTVGGSLPPKVAGDPVVGTLLPRYGTPGSTVDVKGANLGTVSKVEFVGTSAAWVDASYLLVSPSRMVVTVPPGVARGELRLTWPGGRVLSLTQVFEPTVRPSISSVDVVGDPTYNATPGDLLTIRGAGLIVNGVKPEVTIAGQPAPVQLKPTATSKTIVVRVPAVTGGRGAVVVRTPLGSATADQQLFFGPDVKALKPPSYSSTGGTLVTITGSGFTGADAVTVFTGRRSAVTFGGVPVARMVVVSDKQLVVTTSPGSRSVDPMVVTTQHDTKFGSSDGRVRSVEAPIPTVAGVSPGTGPTGGTPPAVTLTGQHLRLTSVVRFGGVAGTVQSAAPDGTSLSVVPPASNEPGPVAIEVVNDDDGDELSALVPEAYTYELQGAVITGKSASTGYAGTTVTITGTSFVDVRSVRFGSVDASYTVATSNTIFATVPATPLGAAGTTVDITVVNSTGDPSTASPATADDWRWDNSPVITSVSPTTVSSGQTVTISGSNFSGVTAVKLGGLSVTFTHVNETTVTAVVPNTPAGLGGVNVDVVVESGGFASRPSTPTADDYVWRAPAVISAMSHNTAPVNTTVTVTGTGFVDVRGVTIGNKVVVFTPVSSTSLTFVVPAADANGGHSAGRQQNVLITNGSGLVSSAVPETADDWIFQ